MTDEGIATEGKLLQPKKQSLPKDVTDEGIVTEVSPLQYWKHRLLIDVIDEGIVTEVSRCKTGNSSPPTTLQTKES